MSHIVNQYRLFCISDNKFEYTWNTEEPTLCPTDTSHTIDTSSITVVNVLENETIKIREESIPTGGNFRCEQHSSAISAGERRYCCSV